MLVLLSIVAVIFAFLIVFRLLSGDQPLSLPWPWQWPRPRLLDEDNIALRPKVPVAPEPVLPEAIDLPVDPQDMPIPLTVKAEKLEVLLLEKNRLIDRLQNELEAERSHRQEFEKVKDLLDEEIVRLKEHNRVLRTHKEKETRNA